MAKFSFIMKEAENRYYLSQKCGQKSTIAGPENGRDWQRSNGIPIAALLYALSTQGIWAPR